MAAPVAWRNLIYNDIRTDKVTREYSGAGAGWPMIFICFAPARDCFIT